MKSCILLVFLTLFAVATAFTVFDKILGKGWNDTDLELADNKDCKCVNARCVYNKGKMKCVCYPKHSPTDEETCQPCDCGNLGECIFVLSRSLTTFVQYEKKCVCNRGSAEKDGKCVACNCGENSKCEFEGDERTCYCLDGYAEKDGVCRECNCGSFGECTFEDGQKTCSCFDGFLLNNGICEECDCGEYGKCRFEDGKKVCECMEGYKENNGYCDECKCEYSYGCDYVSGQKRCWCNPGYIQKDGTCVVNKCTEKCGEKPDVTCFGDPAGDAEVSCGCKDADKLFALESKECRDNLCILQCGKSSEVVCYGDPLREVDCGCDKADKAFIREYKECKECNCGSGSEGCSFQNPDSKSCKCKEGFVQKGEVCEVGCGIYRSCENGGACNGGFCECLPGTSGEFCDVIEECNSLCPEDADCFYDAINEQADCNCKDKERGFNRQTKSCKKTCDVGDSNNCNNGGKCGGKFCDCLPGTSGDLCEIVDECESNPGKCKNGAKCAYNIEEKRAYCNCSDGREEYDTQTERCKRTCDAGDNCNNGGECGGKFCDCPPGTSGDLCEIVDECEANPEKCKDGSKCIYNTEEKKAYCRCPNDGQEYDPQSERCKKTCDVGDENNCNNGGECGGKFCICPPGTSGDLCEVVDECETNPGKCKDGSKCIYNLEEKRAYCRCPNDGQEYDPQSERCKRTCGEGSCNNGGECGGNFCKCPPGTSGDLCEVVDECKENPTKCKDGSECIYNIYKQTAYCKCPNEGTQYDPESELCKRTCDSEQNGCNNGGKCDGTFCDCLPGTSGDLCEEVDECQANPEKCKHGSQCIYSIEEQRAYCKCPFEGTEYDTASERCKRTCEYEEDICKNGGKCDGTFCNCLPGTSGDLCEEVDECQENAEKCKNGSQCIYNIQEEKAVCKCPFEGTEYDPVSEQCKRTCECEDEICKNGGKCGGTFCICLPGTSGDLCEVVDECKANPTKCKDGSECVYNINTQRAYCRCPDEDTQYDSVSERCKKTCDGWEQNSCNNGGKCEEKFCNCLPGTSGDLCEEVDECKANAEKCKDVSECAYNVKEQRAYCKCPYEETQYDHVSQRCKISCRSGGECKNGGECGEEFCNCLEGTSGDLCEDIDECKKGLCGNGDDVKCLFDVNSKIAICECEGSKLFDEVAKVCRSCDCGKNAIDCTFTNGQKVCYCPNGFVEKNGVCEKTQCVDKPCYGGKCSIVDGEEVCRCYEGYALEGDYCRRLNCTNTRCTNGTCVVRQGNIEECVCPAGYSLANGACIRGSCRIDTCFGGYCATIEGELMCVCPKGYHLQGIGCFATVCEIQRCFGGYCVVNDEKEEICTCHDGYVLENDVCKKILCEKKSCFGGHCNIVKGEEVCTCPAEHILHEGVCRLDLSSSRKN